MTPNQTPTPRTDAAIIGTTRFGEGVEYCSANFARQLERELAAEKKRADEGWDLMTHRMEQRDEAEQERDQLRTEIAAKTESFMKVLASYEAAHEQNIKLRAEVERLESELKRVMQLFENPPSH